jgi:hypothetical protein
MLDLSIEKRLLIYKKIFCYANKLKFKDLFLLLFNTLEVHLARESLESSVQCLFEFFLVLIALKFYKFDL